MERAGRDVVVLLFISILLPPTAQATETDIVSTDTTTFILIAIAVLYSIIAAVLLFLLIFCLCYWIRQSTPKPDDTIPLTELKGGGKDEKPLNLPQAKKLPQKVALDTPKPKVSPHAVPKGVPAPYPPVTKILVSNTEEGSRHATAEAVATSGSHTPTPTPNHSTTSFSDVVTADAHGPVRLVQSTRDLSPRRQRKVLSGSSLATVSASATPRGTPSHSTTNLTIEDTHRLVHVVPNIRTSSPRHQRKLAWEHPTSSGNTTPLATPRESPKHSRTSFNPKRTQSPAKIAPKARPHFPRNGEVSHTPSNSPRLDHLPSSAPLPSAPSRSPKLKLRETPDVTPQGTPKLWVRSTAFEGHSKGRKFRVTPKHTPQSTPRLLSRKNTPPGAWRGSTARNAPDFLNKKGVINPLRHSNIEHSAGTSAPNVISLTLELSPISYKWFQMGELLEVSVQALDSIQQLHGSNTEQCMMRMFEEWLKRADQPAWTAMVAVLRSQLINEATLANKIEIQYCRKASRKPEHTLGEPDPEVESAFLSWI